MLYCDRTKLFFPSHISTHICFTPLCYVKVLYFPRPYNKKHISATFLDLTKTIRVILLVSTPGAVCQGTGTFWGGITQTFEYNNVIQKTSKYAMEIINLS